MISASAALIGDEKNKLVANYLLKNNYLKDPHTTPT